MCLIKINKARYSRVLVLINWLIDRCNTKIISGVPIFALTPPWASTNALYNSAHLHSLLLRILVNNLLFVTDGNEPIYLYRNIVNFRHYNAADIRVPAAADFRPCLPPNTAAYIRLQNAAHFRLRSAADFRISTAVDFRCLYALRCPDHFRCLYASGLLQTTCSSPYYGPSRHLKLHYDFRYSS